MLEAALFPVASEAAYISSKQTLQKGSTMPDLAKLGLI